MKAIQTIQALFQKADAHCASIRFLSGNSIKIIAILLMLFDHFCKIDLRWYIDNVMVVAVQKGTMPENQLVEFDWFVRSDLYAIGAIAFPLFCFLIAEGFYHTRNRKRYLCLMGIFALISELPFDISFFSDQAQLAGTYPFFPFYQNVLFTLLLGLLALQGMAHFKPRSAAKPDRFKAALLQIAVVAICAALAALIHSDHGAYGVLLIVAFYISRKNRLCQMLLFFMLYMIVENLMLTWSQLASALILMLYNGQRGKLRLKYFFYIFYPAHMLVLYLLTFVMQDIFG